MSDLRSQDDTAKWLGVSTKTLERHRVAGTGPKYLKIGRLIRYRQSDLEEWVESCVRSSTSESQAA